MLCERLENSRSIVEKQGMVPLLTSSNFCSYTAFYFQRGVGMKDHLFYLVDANVAIPLRNPFRIQKKFVETTNFIPELLPNHTTESILVSPSAIGAKGETWMSEFDFLMQNDSISRLKSPFFPSDSFLRMMADEDDDGEEDEDWDDDEDE